MNFLAHLVLAPQTPEGLVGSIAPDMIRGPLPKDLHPAVAAAAVEHQQVDRFTDAHRAFHRTRQLLSGCIESRLAGILADVMYDHILARTWSDWRADQLQAYVAKAERVLLDHTALMPTHMQAMIGKMNEENWLMSYATADGLQARLASMSRRVSRRLGRPFDLTLTDEQLDRVRPAITDDFAAIWPDLKAYVHERRHRLTSARRAS